MSEETTVVEEKPKKSKTVSQEELAEFKQEVNQGFSKIMEKLEGLAAVPAIKVEEPAGPDEQSPMPPKWRKTVEEILGPEFDCELSQPDNGGTIFRIIVPKEKSNAPSIHWQNFKRDVRSKEIGNTGLDGVKQWCLRVRANLTKSAIKLIQYP